ncbi:MAG: pyruvate kinase [Geobacteraceae bacterium GWC2_55_20]|nr:MAG: pyruvate kinase [Geobacteraceae bacterium GWC2_55_20]OGU19596.1 MAG: pyruvate kinase [Geobacteraceae bacterium GWF2_54_21]
MIDNMREIKRTRIVATWGPSCAIPGMAEKLIAAGVDLFRLNFSHGTHDEKLTALQAIRTAAVSCNVPVGVIADLQGPKIRAGMLINGAMQLTDGAEVGIAVGEYQVNPGIIPTIYEGLVRDVQPGSRILLDDGRMELRVLDTSPDQVRCLVVKGGVLKDKKGINLPQVNVSAPSLTEKDLEDLRFCVGAGVDWVALSFVRTKSDIMNIKIELARLNSEIPVIAKIEKPEAVENLDDIIAVADALMVARGDLGVEMEPEQLPLIQKRMIRACNQAGKPVITATQMLESMTDNCRPTRAEASDVANAILDGTDAVMLSGETAVGCYPLETVSTMAKIALTIERSTVHNSHHLNPQGNEIDIAIARASAEAAESLGAKAIVAMTESGHTAALMSGCRPVAPIIAITPDEGVRRKLSLYWGINSLLMQMQSNTDEMVAESGRLLLANGFHLGDMVVMTMGAPVAARNTTNQIRVFRLGE